MMGDGSLDKLARRSPRRDQFRQHVALLFFPKPVNGNKYLGLVAEPSIKRLRRETRPARDLVAVGGKKIRVD